MKWLNMEHFKNPPAADRGTPFYAWNSEIEETVLKEHLDVFKEMGMGGCCIHSRIGLATEYLGEDFMRLVRFCVEENKKHGMRTLLYDEDKWPSGSGGGRSAADEKYRNRYLLFSKNQYEDGAFKREKTPETRLVLDGKIQRVATYEVVRTDGYLSSYRRLDMRSSEASDLWYAYIVIAGSSPWFNQGYYLDTLNQEAVKEFLKVSYEPYARELQEEFAQSIEAIFTDEPQFSLKESFMSSDGAAEVGIPYTSGFEEIFRERYGVSFLDHLPELLWEPEEQGQYQIRYQYHDCIAECFCSAYMDTIYNWCSNHSLLLTGHVMNEPTLDSQSRTVGEAMRTYRSFHIPGIDILAWRMEYNTVKQAQSAVHQYGRKELTSELYGATNWDFDFRGHKAMGDWQTALGVTNRVHHLSWYSMNGEAKRDYPAPIDSHSPWYREYIQMETYFARIRSAMIRGKPVVHIGVIHPVESYWISLGPEDKTAAFRTVLEKQFASLTEWLLFASLDFDFIAESSIPSLYKGSNKGNLRFGEMEYQVILLPPLRTIRKTTLDMLEEYRKNGGRIICAGAVPSMVDGKQKDIHTLYGKEITPIDFLKEEIINSLVSYREIEILELNGSGCNDYFYQLREDKNERMLFLAKGKAEPAQEHMGVRDLVIVLKGRYSCRFPDPKTGEYKEISWKICGDETKVFWRCYSQDSLLIHLTKATADLVNISVTPNRAIVYSKSVQEQVEYRLEEPNVLVLDQPEYALDSERWEECEEILRIDDKIRNRLHYPLRTESSVQPWAVSEETKITHLVSLRYTIYSETMGIPAAVVIEGTPSVVLWNGQNITTKKTGWYVDRCNEIWDVGTLRKGENTLVLQVPFGEKTNLECSYLLGEFGVVVVGKDVIVTDKPKMISFHDITKQGFAFYGGNIDYMLELDLPEGELEVCIPRYRSALLKVILDEKLEAPIVEASIVEAPFLAKLGKIEKGFHTLRIVSFGNRFNTFGQLHNARQEDYYGPYTWRTKGDGWSYEYKLRPAGILNPPEIYVRRER